MLDDGGHPPKESKRISLRILKRKKNTREFAQKEKELDARNSEIDLSQKGTRQHDKTITRVSKHGEDVPGSTTTTKSGKDGPFYNHMPY